MIKQRIWLGLSTGVALLAAGVGPALASGLGTAVQRSNLQLAVCLSDWNSAIEQVNQMLDAPTLHPMDQATLAVLRRQFQRDRLDGVIRPPDQACDQVLTGFGRSGFTPLQPLALETALLATLGQSNLQVVPDQQARRGQALHAAGLSYLEPTPLEPLSPAQRINTRPGSGVSAGAVSRGVNVYSFLGQEGDTITLDITVTDIRQGMLYYDDDSQLFLFDSEGRLIADNDDFTRLESRIRDVTLPRTGVYYAAVTTYNHSPVLNGDRQIVRWQGLGGSAIDYTLTITGLTPVDQVGRPQ
jgi:hypothetical protein